MKPRKLWSEKTIRLARELRESGASFNEIIGQIGVSKSTLHYWLKHKCKLSNEQVKEMRKRLGKTMQPAGARANHLKRLARIEQTRIEVGKLIKNINLEGLNFKKALLSMLYWAEGTKGGSCLAFTNTDPALCALYIKLLRDTYKIDEQKMRIRVHLHSYHDISKSFSYWSNLLQIPLSQFGKPYVKPRSKTKKFRENFAGICFIKYNSIRLKDEVLQIGDQLAGKICTEPS